MKDIKKEKADRLIVSGKNTCIEAIRSGVGIEKLLILKDIRDQAIEEEIRKRPGMRIERVSKERLYELTSDMRHQGMAALLPGFPYADIDDIFNRALALSEDPFVIVLDGIEDTHNLGAIIRTAHQAGAHGIIIREKRAAGVTAQVIRSSAGAAFYIPIVRVNNISRTLNELKQKGLWISAADMEGHSMYETDLTGPIALVIGSEGRGVAPLVLKNADYSVSVPMLGEIDSLNASVAAALLIYEILRQRRGHS